MGNLGKHRDINKKNLVSEPNYDETIFFFWKFINHGNEKNTNSFEWTSLFTSINIRNE